MKITALVVALAASVALAAPAEAASKKRKKVVRPAPVTAVHSNDVYVGGEFIGRDPDPFIRAMMRRNPHIYDGPE